jgi:hypothetical protein
MASDLAKAMMSAWERSGWTEKVVYRPSKPGLQVREILAVVDRQGPDAVMNEKAFKCHVTTLNDDRLGVPSDPRLSDAKKDGLDVADRIGGPLVRRGIHQFVLSESNADFSVAEVY